ncbi:MAG: hypothetical protein QNJ44_17515 [Rhodobacter sp.]|nr:hypothetical protein [Rhodobacter sp.]
MSTINSEQEFHIDLANLRVQIFMLWGLIAVALAFAAWTLVEWLGSPVRGQAWGPGFYIFAIASLVALVVITRALRGLRRYQSAISTGEAESYAVIIQPDGITVSTNDQAAHYAWADVTRISSDKELLHSGLMQSETFTALLLIRGSPGRRSSLALRWALRAAALRRALFHPFELPGVTVIPVYFFNKPDAKRLFAAARQSHAAFLAARPLGKDPSHHE